MQVNSIAERRGLPGWVIVCGAAIAGALALGLLFALDPAQSGIYPSCPLHALTGLYCPGCGSLRATHLLLHGDLTDALRKNPLLVVSLPLLGLAMVRRRWLYYPWTPWIVLAILVAYGVARNMPWWPLRLLAPR